MSPQETRSLLMTDRDRVRGLRLLAREIISKIYVHGNVHAGSELHVHWQKILDNLDDQPADFRPPPGYAYTDVRWTDWRGNEYGQGDLILYPAGQGSSSAYTIEGRVLDLYHVRMDEHYWKWERCSEAEARNLDHWECEARIVVEVTRQEGGWERRSPVTTLRKNEHVVLLERWNG